ncbi:MAG: HIRAN domain-containing protein [Streptosporangiaceae bacterium]
MTAAWLPGTTEVHVVGERFYAAAIRAVHLGAQPGDDLKGMLVPEPDNPHDQDAVAVYLEGRRVGHLAASISPQVQPALFAFSRSHDGQFVAYPGRIYQLGAGPEVALFLDTEPLGMAPAIFDHVPDLDRVMLQMIDKLDLPAPRMTGCDPAARQALVAAEALRTEIDADFDHGPGAWPRAEGALRDVARRLEKAGDPLVSDAWAGVARSVRYQKGRRDDWIAAAVIAVYWSRSNKDAWAELFDLASAAPHVPTLLELFRRMPAEARPRQLTTLIALSRGRDRLGNMRPEPGARLRAGLAAIAETDNDKPSIRKLAHDARKHADN